MVALVRDLDRLEAFGEFGHPSLGLATVRLGLTNVRLCFARHALGLDEGGGSCFQLAFEHVDTLEGVGVGSRWCRGNGVRGPQATPKLVGLALGLLEPSSDLGIRCSRCIRSFAEPFHLGRRCLEPGLGARGPGLGLAFPGLGVARSLFDLGSSLLRSHGAFLGPDERLVGPGTLLRERDLAGRREEPARTRTHAGQRGDHHEQQEDHRHHRGDSAHERPR